MFSKQLLSADTQRMIGAAVLALGLAGIMAGFGYRWYRNGIEQAAFKEFAQSAETYLRMTTEGSTSFEDQLKDSERAFFAAAQEHRSSVLYPFFIAFQADALLRLGNVDKAAEQLDIAINMMNKQNPLYYLYAIKAALVKIDTKDATLEQQGRDALTKLGANGANPLRDMALFFSALEADAQSDTTAARAQYTEILSHGRKDSYWYQLADAKLKSGD